MNTYEYSCYYGRDRDDWAKGTVKANSLDEAIKNAISELYRIWVQPEQEFSKNH